LRQRGGLCCFNSQPKKISIKTSYLVAALFAVFTLNSSLQAELITFGSGANTFGIDFLNIGNAGNAADTTTYGAVPYEYRMGKYEISQDAITNATASGMTDVTAGAWTGNQPAASITWYEAAAFVNWLNTSTGKTAAYNLTFTTNWSMALWSSEQAWTAGGTNLYRNKDAYYFLPSENEWYKAAYYNAAGTNYFLYPTASSSVPTAVASGTDAGSAVYDQPIEQGPTSVDLAGGLSAYGTMGQGGNVWEWNESAFDGSNNFPSEDRALRGGIWLGSVVLMLALNRGFGDPSLENGDIGFRVASVPEPSTYALLFMTGAGALWLARRRR
jgi:formylglycine-generating enzyme required for sulfatase activity